MSAIKFIKTAFVFIGLISFALVAIADNQPNRPFRIHKLEEAGLEVWVPANPEWTLAIDETSNAVVLSTPPFYYPVTGIEITLNKNTRVSNADLLTVATSSLEEVRRSANVKPRGQDQELTKVTFGNIEAYQDQFNVAFEGKSYSMQTFMGVFPTGQSVTMLVTTPEGQINDISVMRNKIFKKLSVLP